MDDQETRARNRGVVEEAFAAVSRGDVDSQGAHFTDDAVLELPYADPPVRLEGRDAIKAHVRPALEIFKFSLGVEEVYECSDPDLLVLEYSSTGHVVTTGKPYANRYVGVVRFRDGKICFQREYYNPAVAARALAPD